MVLALIFLVAAFLVFFDMVQPAYGDLQTLKGKQLSMENFLQNEQTEVNQAKQLISQYQGESQAQQNLALAMPSGPSVAGALAQIYGIAQNNNIALQNIGFSPPTVRLQAQPAAQTGGASAQATLGQIVKPMGSITIQTTGAGSYENLKSFLSQLETNIRVFDVTSLSLQPVVVVATGKGAAASQDLFTYNFTVATYYQLP